MKLRNIKTKNKKAELKYDAIVAVILGLLVVIIVLFFIFQEFFSQEDADYEVCRQSVVLRSQAALGGALGEELVENYPYKCKTEVIEIDYKDFTKAEKTIAEAMASCFFLFGEGKTILFSSNLKGDKKACFHCARIHFTPEVKDYYTYPGILAIELQDKIKKLKLESKEISKKYADITIDEFGFEKVTFPDTEEGKNAKKNYDFLNNQAEELVQQGIKIQKDFEDLNLVYFKWRKYLQNPFKDGKSYLEFFYPGLELQENQPFLGFSKIDEFGKVIGDYKELFDSDDGDLLVTYMYGTQSYISDFLGVLGKRNYFGNIFTHQKYQNLDCDIIETVPA